MDADVAIIGLGTMGAMTAWQASRRPGVRVIGFEQYGIGHARGAGSGESRLFRTAYHEGAQYVPLLLEARSKWLALERETHRQLFLQVGALSICRPDLPQFARVVEAAERYDLPSQRLDHDELAARYPQHLPLDGEEGIIDLLGGVLRPEAAITGALQLAAVGGARLHTGEKVLTLEPHDSGVTVVTDAGRYEVGHAVVTVGPWSREFVPEARSGVVVQRQALTWFVPRRPDLFLPHLFPAFIRDSEGAHIFGVPMLDGSQVKAGITPFWDHGDAVDGVDRWLADDDVRRIGETVHRFLPDLGPEPARFDIYVESYIEDKTPRILRYQGSPRTTVLTGFSGHGFKLSPAFGRIATDLALDGGTGSDISLFQEPLPQTGFAV